MDALSAGGTLPVRRLPHTGPSRRFSVSRGRIVGGYDAKSGEYPYMVSLQLVVSGSRFYNCGGSIISESAVLTAGQCAVDSGYYIGDPGSPLVQNNEVIGVVSWGIDPCGYQGAPSVYTRVSAHIDFLNQNL
ncbi:lectizyme-like [Schistocerca americana]|uniref:lectizyme-like n=1 Tax=Schistocerca americana TaxID=7009 RepID=UPI001F4FC2F2|nr:lectizyme-like [Schistocerca americana]